MNAAREGFAALQALAGENKVLRGAFMIAEAISNTALAITNATATMPPPSLPFVIPVITAIGAAQVATIAQQMGTDGEAVAAPPGLGGFDIGPTESAAPDFFRTNQSRPQQQQVVLVTEDLTTVQTRVTVTEERASIG